MNFPGQPWIRLRRVVRLDSWHLFWDNRTLAEKLVLGVWLSLVPISLATSIAAMATIEELTLRQLRVEMLDQAHEANSRFNTWREVHLSSLKFLAKLRSVKSLSPPNATTTLSTLHQTYPSFTFFLRNRDGSLIARSAGNLLSKPLNKIERQALSGITTSGLLNDNINNKSCFLSSMPVYAGKPRQQAPIAVLSSCIAINELGKVTGIDDLRKHLNQESAITPRLDLLNGNRRGIAVFKVLHPGLMLLLESQGYSQQEREQMLNPRESIKSHWAPFIKLALNGNQQAEEFTSIRINGKLYYVAVERYNKIQASLFVIDQETVLEGPYKLFRWFWIGNIVALIASSLAITRICKSISQPIEQVGTVLERISQGDFSLQLPDSRGPQGQLFSHVNRASAQLKAYLADSEALTVTNAQLHQARLIQDDFLIQTLPNNDAVELAASFNPAYEIGADWYDALSINGFTIVVVADVCDKGVASALYMSVFRSLLRLNLQREFNTPDSDACLNLAEALTSVNRYMADNHGNTGMFATTFVGAYDPGKRRLSYLVAGHESPLIYQRGVVSNLALGGPALGVIAHARFKPGHCQLGPGSYLLAYSDGLPDARNGRGEAFGLARIKALFEQCAATQPSAQQLLDEVNAAAAAHMGDAEQFDDLTLLTLQVHGPATS